MYEEFFALWEKSKRQVVLTGAGISTLSGIPDFRSSDGLYSKDFGHMRVEDILEIDFFKAHPDVFFSWAKDNWYNLESFEPNIIHKTLKRAEDMGYVTEGIFTQNIDFMHERAGSRKVYPLHGSLKRGYCMNCHSYHEYDEISHLVHENTVPLCSTCGGVIKPDIVFYGEPLESSILSRAESAFYNADLVLVLGTSLIVNPAAALPYISARKGRDIVIVNRDDTYLDSYAKLRYMDLKSFFESFSYFLDGKEKT